MRALKKIWYKVTSFFGRLRCHIRQHRQYVGWISSIYWDNSPQCHYHICIAQQLLGRDITHICPSQKNTGIFSFCSGLEDACDSCPYAATVGFDEEGKVYVDVNDEISGKAYGAMLDKYYASLNNP